MESGNSSGFNGKPYVISGVIIVVSAVFAFLGIYAGAAAAILGCIAVFMILRNGISVPDKDISRVIENRIRISDIRLPANLPFPYAVYEKNGNILFYNGEFESAFTIPEDRNIYKLLGKLDGEKPVQAVSFNGRVYDAYVKPCEVIDKKKVPDKIMSVFTVDVTENSELKIRLERSRLVGAFIFVDNFEEVAESINESSQPILNALIDRRLKKFAEQYGGMIKKYEKDRYIFIITAEALKRLKTDKFDILNEIKTLTVGEHLPVTLSIGISDSAEGVTIDSILKDAKAAIDLALGRGGDQVVIKSGDKYQFFGGLSGEVAHNSRIRARVKADAFCELITGSDAVIVMGHKHPDLDCFGASVGVISIARTMGKRGYILLDEVSPGIKLLYDKLINSGDYGGVFIDEEAAVSVISDTTLIVVADTHRISLVASEEVIKRSKRTVIFDHHRRSADCIEGAVLTYHEPYASSTCELITEMIHHMDDTVKLTANEADALLSGITVDTKDFGLKTGAITFEAAAYLRRKGADSTRVRMLLREDLSAHKAKAEAIENAAIYHDFIVISTCPGNDESVIITAAQAADELLYASGIKAAFVLSCVDGEIYVSARSFGDINVQVIAEKLGGGGHSTIAGLQIKGITIEEAIEKLKAVIDEYLTEVNL